MRLICKADMPSIFRTPPSPSSGGHSPVKPRPNVFSQRNMIHAHQSPLKLQKIIEEIDQRGQAGMTRLTVLKKGSSDPIVSVLSAYGWQVA